MAKSKSEVGTLYGAHVEKEDKITLDELHFEHTHLINVKEEVKTEEKLHNWKKWFNGAKRFWSIKTLPPRN